jgi:hypothetical protein
MFEKGKNICPECFSETVAKYKPWNQPTCSACFLKAHTEINAARDKKKQELKDLQKKLIAAQKERYATWKMIQKVNRAPAKLLTFKEWKAKRIADGTWYP